MHQAYPLKKRRNKIQNIHQKINPLKHLITNLTLPQPLTNTKLTAKTLVRSPKNFLRRKTLISRFLKTAF